MVINKNLGVKDNLAQGVNKIIDSRGELDYKLFLEKTNRDENSIYNHKKRFEQYLNRLDETDHDFLEFLWNTRKKGISIKRLINLSQVYFRFLHTNKNLRDITENQFTEIYAEIFNSSLANWTQRTYFKGVKQILKYYKVHKRIDFDEFKIKGVENPIKPEELLTSEEKNIILKGIKSLKHKVFFTILFNSGLRAGEVFSVNRESFQKVENGYLISINKSKTKLRTVYIYENINLIDQLLETRWQAWDFGHSTSLHIIKRFEKRLNKRLYLHLARHTKATELSQVLTEQELKHYMGWTPDSKMLNNYVHLSGANVLRKLQSIYG